MPCLCVFDWWTLQAIRKLEEILHQRVMNTQGSKGNDSVVRRKDYDIRRLRGELEEERRNVSAQTKKYREQLVSFQTQISDEQQKRRQLQFDLMEREDQIKELQQRCLSRRSAFNESGSLDDYKPTPQTPGLRDQSPDSQGASVSSPTPVVSVARQDEKTGVCSWNLKFPSTHYSST